MENTEIGNPGQFTLVPEQPSRRWKAKGIPDHVSIQMKNPGGISSSCESGLEDAEIDLRNLLDLYQNRKPKGLENAEIGRTHMKNLGKNNLFSGLGMENAEIRSTHMKNLGEFNLLSESRTQNPEIRSTQMKNSGTLGNTANTAADLSFTHCSQKVVFDRVRRDGLKRFADDFRLEYIYDSGLERKTCIYSGCTYSWYGKSSRIMWVGVHGMDSICVVTRGRDSDMIRVSGVLKRRGTKSVLTYFRRTVISEIEDIAHPDTYSVLRQRRDKGIQKPFGVVSVIPRTDEVHKESGHEVLNDEYVGKLKFLVYELKCIQPPIGYDEKEIKEFEEIRRKLVSTITEAIFQASSKAEHDEKKAIEFLQEKMRSNMAFTLDETIQTAISAFQHLFQKKFKADEIKVSVIDPNYFITHQEAGHKDPYVKELEINDIEGYLAAINEPVSGGSGS